MLKRTEDSIYRRARRVGCPLPLRSWSESDEAYLRANYKRNTAKSVASHLNRTVAATNARARLLGVASVSRRFTPDEDAYILLTRGVIPVKTMALALGRDQDTIRSRYRTLIRQGK